MAKYSVAETRDNLSKLIDKALAGEEVVITRHGKPQVALTLVSAEPPVELGKLDMAERRAWMERLDALRAKLPRARRSYVEEKRIEQDEWESRFDR
jgi:prevent-host-death family protein